MTATRLTKPVTEYIYYDFEGGLENVATLYKTSVAAILEANKHIPRFRHAKTEKAFLAKVTNGTRMLLPVPPREMAWLWDARKVKQKGKRRSYNYLRDVCTDANSDPLRFGSPELTQYEVLHFTVNAKLRATYLHAIKDPSELALDDAAPNDIWLDDDATVMVPYPAPRVAATVAAAPHRDDASDEAPWDMVNLAPEWLLDFYGDVVYKLEQDVDALKSASDACLKIQQAAGKELGVLLILNWYLLSMENEQEDSTKQQIEDLRRQLETLQNVATGAMVINPAAVLDAEADRQRQSYGTSVYERVHGAEFAKGMKRALTEPDHDIIVVQDNTPTRTTLRTYLYALTQRALEELSLSYKAGHSFEHLDGAIANMGTATKAGPAGKTAAEMMMSFYGSGIPIVTSSVGNIPGPYTLGVSIIALSCIYALPRLVKHPGDWAKRWAAKMKASFIEAAGLKDDADIQDFEAALASGDRDGLVGWSGKVAAGFHNSTFWHLPITVLNGVGLGLALAQAEDDKGIGTILGKTRWWANVLGAADNTVAGVFAAARPTQWLKTFFDARPGLAEKFGTGFGVVSSYMAMVSGFITALQGLMEHDLTLAVVGAGEYTGAALGVAGMLFRVPELQLLGAAILIGDALLSGWSTFDSDEPFPPKEAFLAILKSFGEGEYFLKIAAKTKELRDTYFEFQETAKASSAYQLFRFSLGQDASLRRMGFPESDIHLLMVPGWEVQLGNGYLQAYQHDPSAM